MAIIRFTDRGLSGYGFDTVHDRVVSFKANAFGQPLQRRNSYYLNNVYHAHYDLSKAANQLEKATKATLGQLTSTKPAPFATAVAKQAATAALSEIPDRVFTEEFVMFSVADKASQYFYANTSVHQALALFAKRGITIKAQDVQVLIPRTGEVIKLRPQAQYVWG